MSVSTKAPEQDARGSGQGVGYARLMRRIERLINLIAALLEAPRPMTAEAIRAEIAGYDQANFDAFRRAFERDKEALRDMGVPIEVVPTDPFSDQADGYVIRKERYYLPDLDLEPDELAALQIAAQAVMGAEEEAGAGLLKLSVDDIGAVAGGRVAWGADVAAELPALGPLFSALLDRRPIGFSYRSASDVVTDRRIEPYGLVHRRGNWYLVGRDVDKQEQRTFKVSRISSEIEQLDGTYQIPEGFDAAAHVAAEAWETGSEHLTANVVFDAPIRWWVDQNLAGHPTKEHEGGGVEVELPVANADAFVSWFVEFAEDATLVAPDSLRTELCRRLAPVLRGGS